MRAQKTIATARCAKAWCSPSSPVLYFQPDDETVPAELRGIGVRIEDDVIVMASEAAKIFLRFCLQRPTRSNAGLPI